MSAAVEIIGVRKTFADSVALDEINLAIADREFVSLLGASGRRNAGSGDDSGSAPPRFPPFTAIRGGLA